MDQKSSYNKTNNGFSGYNLGKDKFIKKILDQAEFDGIRIMVCTHYDEWEAYHRIREEQIFESSNIVYDRDHATMKMANHFHFVLYRGTTVVTVAHVEFLNETAAALRSLATDRTFKRKGYGAHMMGLIEKWVKQQRRNVIKMPAN